MAENDQAAIVSELLKRRDQLAPDKQAVVDELAKRFNLGQPQQPGFFGRLWEGVNPMPLLKHPVDSAKAIFEQPGIRAKQAFEAVKSGNYQEAAGRALQAIPVIGTAAEAGERMAQDLQVGNLKGAAGTFTSVVGPGVVTKGIQRALPTVRTPTIKNPNAVEAAAMQYLESEGVPVSAAAKTGNAYVKNIQKAADSTPVGAVVASRAEHATTEGLRDLSGRLADRANPTPVVPEQAGAGVRSAVEGEAAQHAANANTSYESFRYIEQQPGSLRNVQVGKRLTPEAKAALDTEALKQFGRGYSSGHMGLDAAQLRSVENAVKQAGVDLTPQPVMEKVPMPASVADVKAAIKPIYEDMQKWMEPAKRNASAGFQAMKSILEGPNIVPASQAEAGLGGLKQLAREAGGRNAGLAKFVIPKLQKVIDDAVTDVDPHALIELNAGRAETAAQYGAKAVLDQLRTEPVQTFGQMTYAKDSGIELLRKVQQEAPGELRKVGRAWLEDVFAKAKAEGGYGRSQGIWQQWENLGPETKKLLFDNPMLRGDLNKFFLGAKKLAENPNPSGTSIVGISAGSGALILTSPHTGIPLAIGAGALSKMLHSPRGVRLLTQGMKIPVGKGAASAAIAKNVLQMAGDDVQPLPMAAQSTDQSQQNAPLATAVLR